MRAALSLVVVIGASCSLVQDPSRYTFSDDAGAAMDSAVEDGAAEDGTTADGSSPDAATDASAECTDTSDCPARANAAYDCIGGRCEITDCVEGFLDCDEDGDNGCEVSASDDIRNCGGCGRACSFENAAPVCTEGSCDIESCNSGFADCDDDTANGCEADLRNPEHCGSCGNVCDSSTPICDTTSEPIDCVSSCSSGTMCETSCIDTTSDASHCGGCDQSCDAVAMATSTCVESVCGYECLSSFDDCNGDAVDGCETDLLGSVDHCGMCGQACSGENVASWTCSSGNCVLDSCEPNSGDCNSNASDGCEADLLTDPMNCGRCGGGCPGGQACLRGACSPYTDIAIGQNFGCVVRGGGSVACWGYNGNQQLGQPGANATSAQLNPVSVQLGTAGGASQIALGDSHACIISTDETLYCWGRGGYGERGSGMAVDSNIAEAVESVDPDFATARFVALAARTNNTCALDSTGQVWCWGRNQYGQVGAPTSGTTEPNAVKAVGVDSAVAIDVGSTHACALLDQGEVKCWGRNQVGQLGDGTTTDSDTPVTVQNITTAIDIGLGTSHSCAIEDGGRELYCWGANSNGEHGEVGVAVNPMPRPTDTSGVQWTRGGSGFNCYRDSSGYYCSGSRARGALGDGLLSGLSDGWVPLMNVDVNDVVSIGSANACALSPSSARCWGFNSFGAVGREAVVARPTPMSVGGASFSSVSQISAGGAHACAVESDGRLTCWGRGGEAQLGNGRNLEVSAPTSVDEDNDWTQVAASFFGTCGIKSGQAYCWGTNTNRRLGGSASRHNTPQLIGLAGNEDEISLSTSHACARQGGNVYCWGSNSHGQVQLPAGADVTTPNQISGVNDAVQLATANRVSCALRSTGALTCWGLGYYVGAGITSGNAGPTDVDIVGPISHVDGGWNHFCAVQSGSVWCWGRNSTGAVGPAPLQDIASPVEVATSAPAMRVAAGADFSCAVLQNGSVECWGSSEEYQRGNTQTRTTTPEPVNGISTAVDITIGDEGGRTACARLSDGSAVCWGQNIYGACGAGEALFRADVGNVRGI